MDFTSAKKYLDRDNAVAIGEIIKTHGYKGHVNILFDFDAVLMQEESVLVDINGWLVPFFIDYDESNPEALKPIFKFKTVDTDIAAKKLVHCKVYLPREIAGKYIDLDDYQYLIGYRIIDVVSGKDGVITGFIDMKNNPLITVDCCDTEILVPELAVEVVEIDHQQEIVKIKAPEGIF